MPYFRNHDLTTLSATELAQRIRSRDISPVEVVQQCLDTIDAINPKLTAFVAVYADEALEQAAQAEAQIQQGQKLGALHGIPMAFKDCTPIKGKVTACGSTILKNHVSDRSAWIVERARQQGAIILGKTATPEFAYSFFTCTAEHGHTRNPWNDQHTAGGSSGGAAVAVATGCVALAEGTDMGGSIRIPASFCGTVGFKPSLGRIPFTLLPSSFDTLSHFGPLARTVDDAALFVHSLQGPYEGDILSNTTPLQASQGLQTMEQAPLRLAACVNLGFYSPDPDIEANFRRALDGLRQAGASVTEVDLAWDQHILTVWRTYWSVFMATFYGEYYDRDRASLDPNVAALIEEGRQYSAVHYKSLEIARTRYWQALAAILQNYDALLCPTTARPALPLQACHYQDHSVREDGRYAGFDMTAPFNLFGQCPALSVPNGMTQDGLPTAMQIIGRRNDDATVLHVGRQLEAIQEAA